MKKSPPKLPSLIKSQYDLLYPNEDNPNLTWLGIDNEKHEELMQMRKKIVYLVAQSAKLHQTESSNWMSTKAKLSKIQGREIKLKKSCT